MKIYGEQKYTVKVVVKETCDWCGQEVKRPGYSMYDVDEFSLFWKTGESYPEGGSGPEISVDLCIPCREKLFNLLEARGVKIQRTKWES